MKFSLIIPCYNEEKNISILVKKYKNYLKYKDNELILINNGSKDSTEKIFKTLKKIKNIKTFKINKNIGFGNGLKKGIRVAKGKYLIFSHADLEVDPKDILKSIKIFNHQKKRNNIFIKGKRVNKLKNHWTFSDLFFSTGLTIFSIILFRKILYDIHAQPVLLDKKLIKEIKYFPNDFSIDLTFYIYAKLKGYKIIRFPVNFNKKRRLFGIGNNSSLKKSIKSSIEQIYQAFIILKKL